MYCKKQLSTPFARGWWPLPSLMHVNTGLSDGTMRSVWRSRADD
ncbi:MAG TPA: hypothetical protein VL461_00915 [Dictyobacter sp.]|nr:hypothetical protein [Dictyobacter sp.]